MNIKNGKQDILQLYADCLFNETNIYSVSKLSVEDIMLLRKYSSAFRKKIQTYIDKHLINGTVPTAVIKEDCHSISKEYCDEINSRIASQISKKGLGISLLMDIASIWIIPVTLYNIGQKLWDSVFHKDQRGFVMYLTTLKNIV